MPEEQKGKRKSSTTVEYIKGMPPVSDLFKQSWQLFTAKLLKLFIFFLIIIGVSFALVIVFGIAVAAFGVGSIITGGDANAFASPAVLVPIGLFSLLFVGAFIAFVVATQAGMILLFADSKNEASAFSYFKKGFSFVIPLILVGILNFILIMGGSILLIIPGLVIMLFLIFTMYSVVLDNKGPQKALQMSASMVQQNFAAVLGRILLFFALQIVIQILIGALGEHNTIGPLAILLIFILSVGVSWYGIAYMYVFYKHTRSTYNESKKASMVWMWAVAIIGWIILIFVGGSLIKLASNNGFGDTMRQEMQKEF